MKKKRKRIKKARNVLNLQKKKLNYATQKKTTRSQPSLFLSPIVIAVAINGYEGRWIFGVAVAVRRGRMTGTEHRWCMPLRVAHKRRR